MKNRRILLWAFIILLLIGCLHRLRPEKTTTEVSSSRISLTSTTTSSSVTSTSLPAVVDPPKVKVAILYERLSDGVFIGRSIDDVVAIINDTNADLVFRCFFRWQPVPDSYDSKMLGYPPNYVKQKYEVGYSYEQLSEAIKAIKAAKPNTILIGAIAAQRLNEIEFNDITHDSFSRSETWEMALDPTEIGLPLSKEDGQKMAANFVGSGAYFPDITNSIYQELLLSYAKKQIDLGVDGVWIDALFAQANLINRFGGLKNPNAKESYEASSRIIDEIHSYGYTKYNKRVLVGTWYTFADFPYEPPDVDFVTASPTAEEIISGLDDERWESIKEKFNGTLIIAFIDWNGGGDSPLGVFSQNLTPQQQRDFLVEADAFFAKKGIIFAYPVHGGTFPQSSKRLSFGKYGIYDSLAPEFQTYGTIKVLAQNKSKCSP